MTDYVGGSARELTPDEVAEIERLTLELEQAFLDRHTDSSGLTERERRAVERMTAETRRAIELDVRAQPRIVTEVTTDSSGLVCGRTSYVDPGREPQVKRENREASEAFSTDCCVDVGGPCPCTIVDEVQEQQRRDRFGWNWLIVAFLWGVWGIMAYFAFSGN